MRSMKDLDGVFLPLLFISGSLGCIIGANCNCTIGNVGTICYHQHQETSSFVVRDLRSVPNRCHSKECDLMPAPIRCHSHINSIFITSCALFYTTLRLQYKLATRIERTTIRTALQVIPECVSTRELVSAERPSRCCERRADVLKATSRCWQVGFSRVSLRSGWCLV